VKLVGYVTDAELDVLYRNATVVVSASLYEGFGLTVLEALARAKAVIATNIPAHAELVGDAARLVPPRDVEALVDALDELLEDDASRESLGRAAARRAGEFSLDAMVAGHLDVYETVARARDVLPRFAAHGRMPE
jgi:glycosyltransferase involved in cell wall biosynthesis